MTKTIRSHDSWDLIGSLAKDQQIDAAIAVLKALISNTVLHMRCQPEPIEALQLQMPSANALEVLQNLDTEIQRLAKADRYEEAYKPFESYLKLIARHAGVPSLALRSKLVGAKLQESVPTRLAMKLGPSVLKRRRRTGIGLTFGGGTVSGTPFKRGSEDAVETKAYYTTFEVAEKLGVTPQTIRRMAEQGKFSEAVQTDGGHWRIPQDNFKTTKEQDRKAEDALARLDKKVTDAGEFDEFNL